MREAILDSDYSRYKMTSNVYIANNVSIEKQVTHPKYCQTKNAFFKIQLFVLLFCHCYVVGIQELCTNVLPRWGLIVQRHMMRVGILFQHQQSSYIDTKAVTARTRSGRRRRDAATPATIMIGIMSGTSTLIILNHLL